MTFKPETPENVRTVYDNGMSIGKTHGQRAVRWLANRSLAAWYDPATKSLNALEFKHGRNWTFGVLHNALDATRGA